MNSKSGIKGQTAKRSGKIPFPAQQGFTLLEILIAIFIFAVVMTTIYSAFNAVVSKNEAINEGRGLYEMTRNCLDRMASDFSAIYVEPPPLYEPADFEDSPDPYRFVCTEEMVGTQNFSRVRFASNAHLPLGRDKNTGIAEIIYYVDELEPPKSGYVLRRKDRAYPYETEDRFEDTDDDPIICKGIQTFSVACYDNEGESQAQWDSEEDMGKYATPRSVQIQLTVSNGETKYPFKTAVSLPVYREKMEEGRQGL
ncbi:MAG: type II secretion system protein J [Desulfobacterales bacterium]